MKKNVTISVDADIYEEFCLVVNRNQDSIEGAIYNCMKWYIAEALKKNFEKSNPEILAKSIEHNHSDYYGKAIYRIPLWAMRSDQYNHKIIRAYFRCLQMSGRATVDVMERLCSDRDVPELYVPTFKSNYSQMKFDGPKSHGKVFEDDGETVRIWHEVEEILLRYKSSFSN